MTRASNFRTGPSPLDDLSPLQRVYAVARVENPSLKQFEVARLAGCKSVTANALRVRASELEKRTERARVWLTERAIRDPNNAGLGIEVIKRLAREGTPDNVKLAAAAKLVELSGFQPIKTSEVLHTHRTETDTELRARIGRLIGELSEDERTALARAGLLPAPVVVDAQFEPVSPGQPTDDDDKLDRLLEGDQ